MQYFESGALLCRMVEDGHEHLRTRRDAWQGLWQTYWWSRTTGKFPNFCRKTWRLWAFARCASLTGRACSRSLIDEKDVTVSLSAMEFRLLMMFLQRPQQIVSRESILEHMADRTDSYDRSIDVQVSRLLAKLRDSGRNPTLIRTMRGDGYMLAVPVTKEEGQGDR